MTTKEPAVASCAGNPELFEATDQKSHQAAKSICNTCERLTICGEEAKGIWHKEGTWAGRLYGVGRAQHHPEEALFTEDEARECANLYAKGDRSERVRMGKRVYQRRNWRARKAAAA